MASTVTNSFDADRLHQPIVVAVNIVPMIPLKKTAVQHSIINGTKAMISQIYNSELKELKQYWSWNEYEGYLLKKY